MRTFALLLAAALLYAVPVIALGASVDDADIPISDSNGFNAATVPIWDGPKALLFDNGPFVTSIGTGVGGADESIAAPDEENNGFGCQFEYGYMLTDDFEVPAGETWDISSITLFLYQTGYGPPSTITAVYIEIYDDHPEVGSLVYGDLYIDVLTSTSWTNCFRCLFAVAGTSAERPIMANILEFTDLSLSGGTYYLVWWAEGSEDSGPWANPVTITGTPATGDAWQFTDVWAELLMGGTEEPLGIPFLIEGESSSALENSTWAGIKYSF
jgi:hypothetical protein